jgi:hypothetical protein
LERQHAQIKINGMTQNAVRWGRIRGTRGSMARARRVRCHKYVDAERTNNYIDAVIGPVTML